MRLGGLVVKSASCVRRVAGSNSTQAATYGPWASPSLTVACSASECYLGHIIPAVIGGGFRGGVDVKQSYRNIRNE